MTVSLAFDVQALQQRFNKIGTQYSSDRVKDMQNVLKHGFDSNDSGKISKQESAEWMLGLLSINEDSTPSDLTYQTQVIPQTDGHLLESDVEPIPFMYQGESFDSLYDMTFGEGGVVETQLGTRALQDRFLVTMGFSSQQIDYLKQKLEYAFEEVVMFAFAGGLDTDGRGDVEAVLDAMRLDYLVNHQGVEGATIRLWEEAGGSRDDLIGLAELFNSTADGAAGGGTLVEDNPQAFHNFLFVTVQLADDTVGEDGFTHWQRFQQRMGLGEEVEPRSPQATLAMKSLALEASQDGEQGGENAAEIIYNVLFIPIDTTQTLTEDDPEVIVLAQTLDISKSLDMSGSSGSSGSSNAHNPFNLWSAMEQGNEYARDLESNRSIKDHVSGIVSQAASQTPAFKVI